MEYLIEENPYGYWENPRRRRRRRSRRNPMKSNPMGMAMPKVVRPWTQGVTFDQIIAGGGGMWASTFVPNKFKPSPVSGTDKLMRFGVSFGTALASGMIGKAAFGPKAGQAAVIGGLAGTFLDVLNMTNLLTRRNVGRIATSRPQIRAGTVVSPATTREGETVSIIRP